MNRKEIDLLLARIEGLKSFLEKNSLEDFQKEILRVDNYLKRFGSLDELLSHLKRVEEVAYTAKEFLTIDEVAYYLQVSKSYVYKLTASREFTVCQLPVERPSKGLRKGIEIAPCRTRAARRPHVPSASLRAYHCPASA